MEYMFEHEAVTPNTANQWHERELECHVPDKKHPHVWLLQNFDKQQYCYVFSDEAEQFSNPYRTHSEAVHALKEYCHYALGDEYITLGI